jgi:hypothetical protein
MKQTLLLVWAIVGLLLSASSSSFAQNPRSGKDGFGYKWLRSDTIGGPTYSWVDISTTGTAVQNLGDDNVIGPIPIGFNFTYYWNTYNEVYIGSNGYIMFGRGDVLASGTYDGNYLITVEKSITNRAG